MPVMEEKTNVMRILDQKKIPYKSHFYGLPGSASGAEVARALGEDEALVFKTLVTVGRSGQNYVFLIPVAEELDRRKAAAAVGEKSVDMVKSRELLPLTGYIHGGCSPVGMKKQFRTTIHETVKAMDRIFFSAGKIGCQVEADPADLARVIPYGTADLIADR